MLTPEQIAQYESAGWSKAQMVAQGLIPAEAPPAPPAPPAASVDDLANALDNSSFGSNSSGRRLPAGTHIVECVQFELKRELRGGPRVIFGFRLLSSTSHEADVGSNYSTSFAVTAAKDEYGYDREAVKEICALYWDKADPSAGARTSWNGAKHFMSLCDGGSTKMHGTKWKIEAYTKQKRNGDDFLKYEYGPAPEGAAAAAVPAPPSADVPPPPSAAVPAPPSADVPPPPSAAVPAPPSAAVPPPNWPEGIPFGGGQ